jgi:hypothetical protein
MRKPVLLVALACTVFVAAAPVKPPALDAARKTFVATLKAGNWAALADQIGWPLPIDNYGSPPTVTKAAYLKDHTKLTIFIPDDADLQKCIADHPAEYQGDKTQFGFGSWVVDCNGNEFYFGLKGGKILFTGYQNVNE